MATKYTGTTMKSVADAINKANKGQSSQALIIESYANSVDQQLKVDFSGEPSLMKMKRVSMMDSRLHNHMQINT